MVEGADLDLRKMVESLKDLKEGEFIWGACIDIGEKLHYSPEVTEELKKEMEAKKYNLMLPPTTEEGNIYICIYIYIYIYIGFKVLWERCDQLKEAGAAWIGFNNLPMGDYIFQLTDIIIQLHKRVNIPVMMHFTAGNCTKAQIKELLDKMKEAGIRNLFPMLGGAPPKEWTYASDIIEFIKEEYGDYWCLSGCCYPLVHRHSKNMEDEIKFTKVKVRIIYIYIYINIYILGGCRMPLHSNTAYIRRRCHAKICGFMQSS